jgi:phosphatidylethanolamine/phosphatidyl-N-methylethanolamine N-methyltransferase
VIDSEETLGIGSPAGFYDSARSPSWGFAETTMFGDQGLFFRAWLHQPATIGAIMPTRAPLARAMARATIGSKSVLELGGGTGPITRALIESGVSRHHLTIVERNPAFYRLLTRRFPSLRILCGDAENLSNILGVEGIGLLDAVVSSLPRIGWPLERQRSILEQCFAWLRADGVFLEFSYGPFSPIPRTMLKGLGLVGSRLRWVWGNFPPATIWGYRRARAEPWGPVVPNRTEIDRGKARDTPTYLALSIRQKPKVARPNFANSNVGAGDNQQNVLLGS